MKRIVYSNKAQKVFISFVMIIFLFCSIIPVKSFGAEEVVKGYLGSYIMEVFKSWADHNGDIIKTEDGKKKVNVSEFENVKDIFDESYFTSTTLNVENEKLIKRIRYLIEEILNQIINDNKFYSESGSDLKNSLYDWIYNETLDEDSKYKIDRIRIEYIKDTQNDDLKGVTTTYKIKSITLSEDMINSILEEYDDIKVNNTGKTDEEIFLEENGFKEISKGIYETKSIHGKYACTANVALQIWDQIYVKSEIQSAAIRESNSASFYMNWDQMIEDFGDDISVIKIYFNEITEDNKPKIKDVKKGIKWVEVNEGKLIDHQKYDTDEMINYSMIDEDDELDNANLGGILLSPVFYLINFIADAVISITGTIMDPEQGLDFGTGVLTDTKPNSGYVKTFEYEVETKSFIPTNVIGAIFNDGEIKYQYPHLTYTPEEIFAGKIDLLSIDFISGKNGDGEAITDATEQGKDWLNIRKVVSQWYQVLRMIAIIGLLSVLIYTGIKIILSANAKDKAKYKEWIMNWFMAVAILFSMHFIMAFIVAVTNEIGGLMAEACEGIKVVILKNGVNSGDAFDTNLMGLVRFMIQSENFYIKVGYEVMYIALIWYTLKFTFVYLKRVLSMAFLTLIAPIVALTYPIDKINDGRAQGFDMWLKEYIFNALLQPMHCVLYYVLVGSAVSIAASNPLYGIVVLAFMTEAEKLLKKIFGFDKAGGGTVGGMANAFAAGAIASSIAKMVKLPKGNGGNGGGGADTKALDNPKPTDKPGMDVFDGSGAGIPDPEPESNLELPSGGASAAEAFQNSTDPIRDSRRELLEEQLADGQISNDDLSDADKALLGIGAAEAPKPDTEQEIDSSNGDSGKDVRQLAAEKETSRQESKEKSKFAKGAGAVSKKLLKSIWDADKSKSYNFKRIAKGVGRATIGASLGIGAAAVQAGISITDGKYKPLEGVAAFTAGYAGGGQVAKGIGGLVDTYKDGANAGDKGAQMKRAKDRFGDRDDVIAFNKKNYPGQEQAAMERQKENYLTAGVTDLKEMKSGMKYADTLVGKTDGLSADEIKAKREKADRMAAATIDFKKTLQDQGQLKAVYDKDKREKYIQSMVDKAKDADKTRVRKQYENAFKSVVAYDAANA